MNISKRLPSGAEVLLRPIPRHYRQPLDASGEMPSEPERPKKAVQSVDGHSEYVSIQEGDPEYAAWLDERAKYLRECAQIRKRLENVRFLEHLDYGVVGWIMPGPFQWLRKLLGLWSKHPPKLWQPHPITRHTEGITERATYIVSELLLLDEDYDPVIEALLPMPITSSEVDAQLSGFRPESGAGKDANQGSDSGA